jgi:hypothetical protein
MYMVLPGALTICYFRPLNDVMCIDIRMSSHRLQCEAVRFPSRKIVRAVHRDAASLDLSLDFVLSKPEEFSRLLINGDSTSVRIHKIAFRISPSSSGNDPFGGDGCGRQQ